MDTDTGIGLAVAIVPTIFVWITEISVATTSVVKSADPLWFWGQPLPVIWVWHIWMWALLMTCWYAAYRLVDHGS